VRIEGVLHEFSSIPGVVEDATDIILNLKQIPFKLHTGEAKTIRVSRSEPGEMKSGDIELDDDVEVLDPNVHIATVSEGGNLNIEMRIKRGRGYISADRNFDDDLPVGYIPVDSVHSPITKVNFHVEAARLGQDTDYDKLLLEVWTNGSVTPEFAIGLAAKLIKDHMAIFINFEEEIHEQPEPVAQKSIPAYNEHLDKSIDELELSVRSYNCLKNSDIKTIRDLVQKKEPEMLKTKNFGRKSLNEIKDILTGMGLGLGMQFDDQGNIIKGPDAP
jgi:DNA-directed RNA polymerase subunit alpha